MRRRPSADTEMPQSLSADGLLPRPIDDPSLPYELRKRHFQRWLEKRNAWVSAREDWAARHGWPGGDLARFDEEQIAHPIPDGPFDPAWEIAHGDL